MAENLELVRAGCCNLARHIANAQKFGVPVVVAINRFATDTDAELEVVRQEALAAGEAARASAAAAVAPPALFHTFVARNAALDATLALVGCPPKQEGLWAGQMACTLNVTFHARCKVASPERCAPG